MKLLKLEIQGFGPLSGTLQLAASGVNLIIAPNESGKTTLVEAIRAALYGPHTPDGRTRLGRHLACFEPRHGGGFGLSMQVEVKGRKLLINRDFKCGSAHVYEDGQDVTGSFRVGKDRLEIGEQFVQSRKQCAPAHQGDPGVEQVAGQFRRGSVQARPMMCLALSYDHRIIDGKEAVGFLVKIKECLEDPGRMLLGV